MSVWYGILARARSDPLRPAVLLADRAITYGMILSGTLSAESRLRQLGVTRRDVVAVDVGNPARHLIIVLALWRLGIASASIRPDLIEAAASAGFTLLLSDTASPPQASMRLAQVAEDWFTHATSDDITPAPPAFEPDDAFRITFSSGSTGRPKPIVHTEPAYCRRIFDTCVTSFQRPWTRLMLLGGLSTGFGAARSLQSLWLGQTVCFSRSSDEAIHMISHFGIDAIMGSPTLVMDLLERHRHNDIPLPSLTSIQFGGASMTFADIARLRTRFGADLIEEYASTEASIAGIAPGRLLSAREAGAPIFSPVLPVQVMREGTNLPPGQEGDIRIWSPSLGTPYEGRSKCPANDGWFYPGDRGVMLANGLFAVLGRKDNVINTGGVKRHAEVVEEFLLRHPKVRDVAVAAVKSDRKTIVRAIVVASSPLAPAELVAWTRGVSPLAFVDDVRFVDAIPRTATGKIAREAVAALADREDAGRIVGRQ